METVLEEGGEGKGVKGGGGGEGKEMFTTKNRKVTFPKTISLEISGFNHFSYCKT
jgi:hypothetical protein